MGCGASAARAEPALDPGELRDLSKPNTVVLREGVAAAGQRDPEAQKRNSLKGTAKAESQEASDPSPLKATGQDEQLKEPPKAQCPDQPSPPESGLPVAKEPEPEAERQLRKKNSKSTSQRVTAPPPEEKQDREPPEARSLGPAADADPDCQPQPEPPGPPDPSAPPAGPPSASIAEAAANTDGNAIDGSAPAATAATASAAWATEALDDRDDDAAAAADSAGPSSRASSRSPSSAHGSPPSSPPPPPPNPGTEYTDLEDGMWGPHRPAGAAKAAATAAASKAGACRTDSSSSSASPKAKPAHTPKPPAGPPPPKPPPAAVVAAPPQPAVQQPPHPSGPPQPRMVDCAVSLQFLIDFCGTVPEDMPTWRVVTDVVVPATRERRCRYVEVLERHQVGHCDYFISHRWATPFSHLVRYVRKHLVELGDVAEAQAGVEGGDGSDSVTAAAAAEGVVVTKAAAKAAAAAAVEDDEEAVPKRSADKVFVWCDIFAINQHPGQVQADDLSQLKDCVEASQQTLLCLDDKGLVLTRIWCLYEIWNTVLAGGPPKLAVLGYDVNQDAFKEVYITLDVEEAQATVDSDRVRILADIAASTGLQELNLVVKGALVESTQAEAENALQVLLPRAAEWKDFQRVIEAVNKHVQMLTTLGRHQEAQRYGYIIQTVSTSWQNAMAAKTHGSVSGSGSGSAAAGAAGAVRTSGSGAPVGAAVLGDGGEALPEWHWRSYPREPALRQVLDRAAAAERHGHLDSAMNLYRDAVDKAEQRLRSSTPLSSGSARRPSAGSGGAGSAGGGGGGGASASSDASSAAASLDLAGCRLRLGVFLVMRGFIDQAVSEAGEPAVAAFEAHAGARSLTFASAAHQVAVLAKNSWERRELRARLLDAAYDIQGSQLGPTHGATLDSLREKAELTYMSGDYEAGLELFRKLAVRLSEGTDLAARPPSSAAAAAAAATAAAASDLSAKALEVWFLLATYLSAREGREDEVIRICRALIPHKRRDHIRRLRAAATDPSSQYVDQAVSELRRLGLSRAAATGSCSSRSSSRPASTASSSLAGGRGGGGRGSGGGAVSGLEVPASGVEVEPDGLCDPDDPRVDVIGNSSELTLWSTTLAKQGRREDAVLLQWRLAEAYRGHPQTATLETQLPSGTVTMVDAYERCLMLDLQVPGIAKLAAKMLAERDGHGQGNDSGSGAATATAAVPAAAAVAAASRYDGPSYMELVQEMTALWTALDFGGAEPVCRRIVECQSAAHGSVSREVVDAREQLARLLQSAGRQEEAVAEMRAALAVHEQILHGKDPAMSRTLNTLADMVPDKAEGEKLHRRAVDLLTKVHGPEHYDVGQALMQLGGFIMSSASALDGGDVAARIEEGQAVLARGQDILAKFQQQQKTMIKAF